MSSSPPMSDQSDGNNNIGTPDSSTNCVPKPNAKSSHKKESSTLTKKAHLTTKALPMIVTTNGASVASSNVPLLKRANKPLMEKRRRARINQSLALLKALILDSAKTENTKHSKLEKADILELTVRHLQRQKILSSDIRSKYKAGYEECSKEVSRFFDTPELHLGLSTTSNTGKSNAKSSSVAIASLMSGDPVIDAAVKQRLYRHLENCMSEIDLDFCASAEKLGINQDFSSEDDLFHMVRLRPEPDSSTTPLPANSNPPKVNFSTNNNNSNSFHQCRKKHKSKSDKSVTPSDVTTDSNSNHSSNTVDNALSVLQVIPSRLPDGQVVFILPSHYVQVDKDDLKTPMSPSCYDQPLDFSLKRDDSMWRPW